MKKGNSREMQISLQIVKAKKVDRKVIIVRQAFSYLDNA